MTTASNSEYATRGRFDDRATEQEPEAERLIACETSEESPRTAEGEDERKEEREEGEDGNARMRVDPRLGSCRNWSSFWMLGMLNNFAYVVILCGAANLADSFGAGKLTGVVPWANVSIGLGSRMLNMCCLEAPVKTRILTTGTVFFLGYGLLATSVRKKFSTVSTCSLFTM